MHLIKFRGMVLKNMLGTCMCLTKGNMFTAEFTGTVIRICGLDVQQEPHNDEDCFAVVSILKAGAVVSHIPHEVSHICI